jgi:CHAT domain-containing protein
MTLNNLGLTLVQVGDPKRGLAVLVPALEIFQDLGNDKYIAATLDSMGSAHQALGDHARALESFGRSLFIWRRIAYKEGERVTLANLGTFYRERGQALLGILYLKLAVNASQELRAGTVGLDRELQQTFTRRVEDSYRTLAELLIENGRLIEAEQVLAMLKEYEHFEFLRRDGTSDPRSTTVPLSEWEQELANALNQNAEKIAAIQAELNALAARSETTVEDQQRRQRLRDQIELEGNRLYEFISDMERAAEGPSGEPVKELARAARSAATRKDLLADLQAESGDGPAIVYFLPSGKVTNILVVTKDNHFVHQYPVGEKELNILIDRLRRAIQQREPGYREIAAQLYEVLVRPFENDLKRLEVNTLMLYLVGALRYLPFAALYDAVGDKHLVEKYSLTVYTAAAEWSLKDTPAERWSAAAFGVSKPQPGFDPLPAVPLELARIVREPTDAAPFGVLPGDRYLDEKFTEEQLFKLLDGKRHHPVMHLATHFKLAPGSEDGSFLLLGNGKLSLKQISANPNIRLRGYDLVTLSGCETVLGSGARGVEVESLGVTLQQKGAKAVLATLWKVEDAGTARLMEAFYRARGEQRRISKSEALRQAQRALLQGEFRADDHTTDLTHPYFWAPFVLLGNWM